MKWNECDTRDRETLFNIFHILLRDTYIDDQEPTSFESIESASMYLMTNIRNLHVDVGLIALWNLILITCVAAAALIGATLSVSSTQSSFKSWSFYLILTERSIFTRLVRNTRIWDTFRSFLFYERIHSGPCFYLRQRRYLSLSHFIRFRFKHFTYVGVFHHDSSAMK